ADTPFGRFDVAYVDAKEQVQRLQLPPAHYLFPRLSPDERRLAVETDDGKGAHVWIYEMSGATSIRPLTSSGRNRYPVWSGDGTSVAFQSDREGDLDFCAARRRELSRGAPDET